MTPKATYDPVARFLHGLIALLIIAQFVIALTMPDVHKDTKPDGLIAWHVAFGVIILALMVVRVVWRLTHRPPPLIGAKGLNAIALLVHGVLYLTLIAVPLFGWASATARDWVVSIFGYLPLPDLGSANSQLGGPLGDIHAILAWVLLALIVVHLLAVWVHHYIFRDRTLQRMFPSLPSRS